MQLIEYLTIIHNKRMNITMMTNTTYNNSSPYIISVVGGGNRRPTMYPFINGSSNHRVPLPTSTEELFIFLGVIFGLLLLFMCWLIISDGGGNTIMFCCCCCCIAVESCVDNCRKMIVKPTPPIQISTEIV